MLASIPSPSVSTISLGPLEIHLYGVLVALGVAAAFTITRRRYEAAGGDGDLVDRVMVWTVLIGFLGARAGYVTTHLDRFADRPWAVLFVWEGGLAFFGGLLFGGITAYALLRRWGGDVPAFADGVAVGIPVAQAIGRWGNYFNQELFGTPSDLPWAVEIAPRFRPEQYADASTFHPTFLYESLANLLAVGVILAVERRRSWRRGSLFLLYLVLYGVIRFATELIRTDTAFRVLGLSRNGWIAALVALAGAAVLVRREGGELPGDDEPSRDDEPGDGDAAEQPVAERQAGVEG